MTLYQCPSQSLLARVAHVRGSSVPSCLVSGASAIVRWFGVHLWSPLVFSVRSIRLHTAGFSWSEGTQDSLWTVQLLLLGKLLSPEVHFIYTMWPIFWVRSFHPYPANISETQIASFEWCKNREKFKLHLYRLLRDFFFSAQGWTIKGIWKEDCCLIIYFLFSKPHSQIWHIFLFLLLG